MPGSILCVFVDHLDVFVEHAKNGNDGFVEHAQLGNDFVVIVALTFHLRKTWIVHDHRRLLKSFDWMTYIAYYMSCTARYARWQ